MQAIVLWPAVAAAHPFPALRREIVAEVERGTTPAFAIAVLHNGKVVWEEGFGSIDQDPVTAHTPFSLASVSKPITATALMTVVRKGKIDLDRPIDDYLGGPRLTGRGGDPSQATVRRVASHTAGLPVHFRFFAEGARRSSFEETLARYGFVLQPPGTAFRYSNLGYRLLERTLEVATGEPFAEVLRREVFAPLGMRDAILVTSENDGSGLAPRTGADGEVLPYYSSEHPGGSDIYASANDLARFAAFHLGALLPGQEEILDRRAREQMRRPLTPRGNYGIGWVVEEGGSVVGHTGGMPGTRAALYLMPDRKLAVATLAASETDLPQRIGRKVLGTYLKLPGRTSYSGGVGMSSDGPRRKRPSRRLTGTWTGAVAVNGSSIPLTIVVEKGGRIRARLDSGAEKTLLTGRFSRRALSAWLSGVDLRGCDAPAGRYQLQLVLELEGDRLRGTATAYGRDEFSLPFALGHWVELARSEQQY